MKVAVMVCLVLYTLVALLVFTRFQANAATCLARAESASEARQEAAAATYTMARATYEGVGVAALLGTFVVGVLAMGPMVPKKAKAPKQPE